MPLKLPKYLAQWEVNKILEAPDQEQYRDRLVLRLFYKCGLRVSEVVTLRCEHIFPDEDRLLFRLGRRLGILESIDHFESPQVRSRVEWKLEELERRFPGKLDTIINRLAGMYI